MSSVATPPLMTALLYVIITFIMPGRRLRRRREQSGTVRQAPDVSEISHNNTMRLISDYGLLEGGAIYEGDRLVVTKRQIEEIAREALFGSLLNTDREPARLFHPHDVAISALSDMDVNIGRVGEDLDRVAAGFDAGMFHRLVPPVADNRRLFGRVVGVGEELSCGEQLLTKHSRYGSVAYQIASSYEVGARRNRLSSVMIYRNENKIGQRWTSSRELAEGHCWDQAVTRLTYDESGALADIWNKFVAGNGSRREFRNARQVGADCAVETDAADRLVRETAQRKWGNDPEGFGVGMTLGVHPKVRVTRTSSPVGRGGDGVMLVAEFSYNPLSDRFEAGDGSGQSFSSPEASVILGELLQTIPVLRD